jgi:hypothetical protein
MRLRFHETCIGFGFLVAGAWVWVCCLRRLMRLCSYETCIGFGLLASPLCGAAVTFFAAAKKVTKESSYGVSGVRT